MFDHKSLVNLVVGKGLLELILSCTRGEALGLEEIQSRLLHLVKLIKVEFTMAFLRC